MLYQHDYIQVKIKGQGYWSKSTVTWWEMFLLCSGYALWSYTFYGCTLHCVVFWLFVEFCVLKWSVRPRVRAF